MKPLRHLVPFALLTLSAACSSAPKVETPPNPSVSATPPASAPPSTSPPAPVPSTSSSPTAILQKPPVVVGPPAVAIADEGPYADMKLKKAADPAKKKPRPKRRAGKKGAAPDKAEGEKKRTAPHPEPGVIVDVAPVTGADQKAIQKETRAKAYGAIRACYDTGLRRNQRLSGKVTTELTLQANGRATDAAKTTSTLQDESVSQCVTRELARLTYPAPTSGTPTLSIQVTLSPGDAPVPVPRALRHPDRFRDRLRSKWSEVERCYASGLERRQYLGGQLILSFQVRGNGEVVKVAETDSRFADSEVSKCVVAAYRRLKFGKLGGRKHDFVYPLQLEAIYVRK